MPTLCQSSLVQGGFTDEEIKRTELEIQQWLLHLDEKFEDWNNVHMDSFHTNEPKHGRFQMMMPPEGPKCKEELKWFGDPAKHDTEKPICNPGNQLFAHENCDLISVGSNNEWETEVGMYQTTKCKIHTFDCTSQDTRPAEIKDRTTFHKFCITDKSYTDSSGSKFLSWPDVLEQSGITQPPEYLKMDIEGFEFPVLRSIVRSGRLLPNQIAMEIHWATYGPGSGNPSSNLPWAKVPRHKDAAELLTFLLMMYEAGYRLSFVDHGTVCPHCMEVLFSRVHCGNGLPLDDGSSWRQPGSSQSTSSQASMLSRPVSPQPVSAQPISQPVSLTLDSSQPSTSQPVCATGAVSQVAVGAIGAATFVVGLLLGLVAAKCCRQGSKDVVDFEGVRIGKAEE